ncbi:MAG: YitT family protein [Lachnospiraceae bacterium]|nr:YitT family protein [Lachnospiraceae bacterium]
MKQFGKRVIVDYLLILAGTGLMAFAISSIYDPAGMVTGGVSGLAIIIKDLTIPYVEGGISLGLTNLILNVPIFLVAAKQRGLGYIARTLVATLALSAWLSILPVVPLSPGDYVLSALFGGVISGVGIGMVFLAQATTGGTDLVAAIIQKYMPHYTISDIMQVIDGLVVIGGAFLFGIHVAMYAIIAIYLVSKISDSIIEGRKFSKAAFIVTEDPPKVASVLMEHLGRGVTGIAATGMYSGQTRQMLYCVVSRREIVTLKGLVLQEDPKAFVIVTDAREVLGEGFQEYCP